MYSKRRSVRWRKEFNDLITGISGGFLFGVPLLYTMEVWFIGSYVEPEILLLILLITFVLLFILNRVEGFRLSRKDYQTNLDAFAESVEALAIGIILSIGTLLLLQRIDGQTSLSEILGKIVFEAVPFAFGVGLSRLILSGERSSNNHTPQTNPSRGEITETLADFSATAIGAVIIAFSIAPTDEVAVIAAASSPPWLIVVVVVSLLVSYSIVFAAGFTTQAKRRQQRGLFQTPFSETIFSYLVSLLVAMMMLWFFQRITPSDPLELWLRYTIILGLPATIGGAAGRLAI